MSVLSTRDLSIAYAREGRLFRAVEGASLAIERGSAVGLVGESGSGKTTLALSLMGLLPGTGRVVGGSIRYDQTVVSDISEDSWRRLRWTKVAIVFQGGMNALNPVQRVLSQIVEPMLVHRTEATRDASVRRALDLLELVGISRRRARDYPHEFSGGMRQRACIAMALACKPEILIADEPTTALDVIVQSQIMRLLSELRSALGLALLIITHDLGVVAQLCDEVLVMYAGQLVETGPVSSLFHDAKHPYSRLLLDSVPRISRGRAIGGGIPGAGPSSGAAPSGCRFHPRCPLAMPVCSVDAPTISWFDRDHAVACHLHGQ